MTTEWLQNYQKGFSIIMSKNYLSFILGGAQE